MADELRFYFVVNASKLPNDVRDFYRAEDLDSLGKWIASAGGLGASLESAFHVTREPLSSNRIRFVPKQARGPSAVDELVVSLTIHREDALDPIAKSLAGLSAYLGGGSNIPFACADHWAPTDATDPIFGDRSAVERLLGLKYVRDEKGLTGDGVNVVIIDQGLNADQLGDRYGGGWNVRDGAQAGTAEHRPGSRKRPHGMMIANNILQVAPQARLWDLPLLPPPKSDIASRISDIPVFLNLAQPAISDMLDRIRSYIADGIGPWVLVNPWAIYDSRSDLKPPYDYIKNPMHIFNKLVGYAVRDGIDVVFGAGNCGQFCPDRRCSATDQGPGRSILGANSHPDVLTVGAVRTDEMWLGYSSQGPGQAQLETGTPEPNRASRKPDVCAPSQFCENGDAFTINTGTSAACALATGVVAALRGRWKDTTALPPAKLKDVLINTARRHDGPRWDGRLGHGILDAKAAYEALHATS
jgi:subtilisin family serine protease